MFSDTGRQHGWGSDPYKWVSGLTKLERETVRNGGIVLITHGVSIHGGNPPYRQVIYRDGRYLPRVPDQTTLDLIRIWIEGEE
jgi:hypothetical protein